MKLTRTLMIAVLPSLLLACAGEPASESTLGEIDSPEALAGSAETSFVDEEQSEPASPEDLQEEGHPAASDKPAETASADQDESARVEADVPERVARAEFQGAQKDGSSGG